MNYKINIKNKFCIVLIILILIFSLLLIYINKAKFTTPPDFTGKHLVVYSCLREEETKSILELFKKETNCSYEYIQLPTQEAVSRIEDEKNSPKADIFLSGTKSSLQLLDKTNSIKKYISKNNNNVPNEFKSKNGKWIAFEVHPFSIVINKDCWDKKFSNKNVKLPKNFEDLANPIFKGELALPNPLTSGTGYSFINYLNDYLGEENYKNIIYKIKDNTGIFLTRGYNVVQNIASGEYTIGISYLSNIKLMQNTKSNLIVITPKNVGLDLHGVGIINKNDNIETSKSFVDFIISNNTQEKLKDFSCSFPIIDYNHYNQYPLINNLSTTNLAMDIWKNS